MPIRINEVSGEQFHVVQAWGKLEKADYEKFLPNSHDSRDAPPIVGQQDIRLQGPLRRLGGDDLSSFRGWA